MEIKLIATDLDDTLLVADHLTVSEKTVEALKRAHDKGIKVAIATGRTVAVIDYVTDQVPFTDYVIYSNGAGVYDRNEGKMIYNCCLETETAVEIVKFASKYPVFFDVYKEGGQHSQKGAEKNYTYTGLPQKFLEAYMATMVQHEDIVSFVKGGQIEKVNLFSAGKYEKEFKEFLAKFKGLSITYPFADSMEITNEKANKGEALKNLAKILGIGAENVMAFGDSDNDVTMMRYADYSVAMGNAAEGCKRAAKYVTLSNNEDGIAAAIDKYIFGE